MKFNTFQKWICSLSFRSFSQFRDDLLWPCALSYWTSAHRKPIKTGSSPALPNTEKTRRQQGPPRAPLRVPPEQRLRRSCHRAWSVFARLSRPVIRWSESRPQAGLVEARAEKSIRAAFRTLFGFLLECDHRFQKRNLKDLCPPSYNKLTRLRHLQRTVEGSRGESREGPQTSCRQETAHLRVFTQNSPLKNL